MARAADDRSHNIDGTIEAAQQIATFEQWTTVDHREADERAKALAERIAEIKASSVDLRRLETRRNGA